ncbi:secondary thiamine-phosphate synthase enzyme YjbQ [Christensenellaceae bacterium OttesenSCG-928-L17]|nr:secondary thiamine-phosphate synthase enzyme YjbQ [Christensenellaceae bacterium OttesenSCG-928-L17]
MVYRQEIVLNSNDKVCTFHDITEETREIVKKSGVQTGTVTVYSHHTTCSVITQECAFDVSMTGLETLQQDFIDCLDKLMPEQRREGMYLHPGPKAIQFAAEHDEDLRGCHNTDAHLRSAMVGRSITVVVYNGVPDLGEFGRVHFIDFDTTRARRRIAQVIVMGE